MSVDPVALSPDGHAVAVGDGPELLAYRGDGAPTWKVFTDGILVGLGYVVDQLVCIDDRGVVTWRRRGDGQALHEVELGVAARGGEVSADGGVVVLTDDGLWVLGPGSPARFVAAAAASVVAFGPNSQSVGVGHASGVFAAHDPATGLAWGSVDLGAPVAGVAWCVNGQWVVAAGEALHLVSGDGATLQARLTLPGPGADVAVSLDGTLAAVICGTHVQVFELQGQGDCGALQFRRELLHLAFGAGHWLGVGLDDGDATLVELLTGSPTRTEPHPGRGRNVWAMENKVERDRVRGAVARHRAGGEPIARWVAPEVEEEEAEEGSGCLRSAAMVGCFSMGMLAVSLGLIALLWWMQQEGWF